MTQELFHRPQLEFQKLAAEAMLPEDPNRWPDEVLQELFKQVPYLSDFDVNIVMETVDGERGYGLGHAEVSSKTEAPANSSPAQMQAAGIRSARIPIIIKDSKLAPFDVVVTDNSNVVPLTERRLRQAMFRPQNFDVTSKTPGDQSMIGQLYPPYRQNYGFGGGGVAVNAGMGGKTASANGSILSDVLATARLSDIDSFKQALRDSNVKLAYAENVATYEALERISEANPTTLEKRASAMATLIRPSVIQVVRLAEGYEVKTASHRAWAPTSEILDRGQLVQKLGADAALAADTAGATTMAPEAGITESAAPPTAAGPISAPGMYQVQTTDGASLVGAVIPNLLDVDGSSLPISLFTDGAHAAVQGDIAGVPVGEFSPPGTVPATQATGRGVFCTMTGGIPQATLPVSITATLQNPGVDDMPRLQAETFDGRPIQVSVQPYVQSVIGVDGTMLIPDSWAWIPLDGAEDVDLAESAAEVGKMASVLNRLSTVEIHAGGADCFMLRGVPVEKLAADERSFLDQDQAMFLLVGLGVDPQYAQNKLAEALGSYQKVASVSVGHGLRLVQEVVGQSYVKAQDYLANVPSFRHQLWKEAAVIPDPVAVDTVLSLGFINPENLARYVGYLPTLDEAQSRLCDLLLGARLGLRELSEGAIGRAIRALEEVIEGVKVLAFQG